MTDIAIYDALCLLRQTQLDEVIFAAGVPRQHIPPRTAEIAMQANALIEWEKQSPVNREALLRALSRAQQRSVHYETVALEDRFTQLQHVSSARERTIQSEIERLREGMRRGRELAQRLVRCPIPIPLPALHGAFMDRVQERDTLHHLLRRTDTRMVVIVGQGGYGKTELISKLLQEIAPLSEIDVPDIQGILYLRCLRGDLSLSRTFAEAGRIAGEPEKFRELYAQTELTLDRKCESFLTELSRVGDVWIILDNLEDLLAADDSVADEELRVFLEMTAATNHRVRLIATTRTIPRFRGSQRAKVIDLRDGLPENEAIEFLRIEGADFGLGDTAESLLRALVRRVHGIPKALESVLGYLSERFPVVTLAHLMADPVVFADFDRHDADSGMKRLIAEQFRDQPADAQLTLCALSIFPKAAPLAALHSLLPSLDLAIVLPRLERNRLVGRQGDRYEMHPLVQEHAYEQIPETAPEFVRSAEGAQRSSATHEFTRRALHIRAAEFFRKLKAPSPDWKSLADLAPHLDELGHRVRAEQFEVAASIFDAIDTKLGTWGQHRLRIELVATLGSHIGDASKRRDRLRSAGYSHMVLGDTTRAVELFEEALRSARGDNSRRGIAVTLERLGAVYEGKRDLRKCEECLLEALHLYEELDDEIEIADVLGELGFLAQELGNIREAHRSYQSRLEVFRKRRAEDRIARAIGLLGIAKALLGQFNEAITLLNESLQGFTAEGDVLGQSVALSCIGATLAMRGNDVEAIDYYERALALGKRIGHFQGVSYRFLGLATAYHFSGNLAEARTNYREAIAHAVPKTELDAKIQFGILLLEEGHSEKGLRLINEGKATAEQILQRCPGLFKESYFVAFASLALGLQSEAIAGYRRALEICAEKGVVIDALNSVRALARAPNVAGTEEVRALLDEALNEPAVLIGIAEDEPHAGGTTTH